MAIRNATFERLFMSVAASAVLGMLMTSPAAAQDQTAAKAAAAQQLTLGEVIVTATRRPERLSKVPVAVSVVDGDRLRTSNLTSIRDVSTIVPSLNFRTTASNKDQALFVRGLGTVSTSPGVEPTVSTVVDGVVLGRQGQASYDLYDVDRIEILRGPQGTLFGKNASGGVVNIITRSPTDIIHAYGDVFYGGFGDEWRLKAGISGPIVSGRIRAAVNVLYADYDGYGTNVFDGQKVGGYNRTGARAKVVFLPTENLTLTLNADYLRSKDRTPQGVVGRTYLTAYPTNVVTSFPAFAAAVAPVVAGEDNLQINSNYPTFADDKSGGVSLQADWDVGGHTVTSVTAYRRWKNLQHQDQDRLPGVTTAFAQQHDIGELDFDQISEELRIASPKGNFLEYVVGGYFFKGEDTETYRRDTTTLTAGVTRVFTGIADYGITNENYSAFGEATFNFSPRFRGIAGVRAVKDELSFKFSRVSTSPTPVTGIQTSFAASGATSPTGYADRVGLQFDVTPTSMAYFTYSRGYKGPAYNVAFSMLPQDTGALKSETNNAYELGLKARTTDGRLAVNAAGFIEEFSNYQVNFFDTYNGSPVTRLINAGAVSTKGVEVDLTARPVPHLTFSASGAYIRARIDSFTCPAGTAASCQVNGKPLPYSPDWKYNLRGNYTIQVSGSLNLDLTSEYSWQSKTQFSINQTPDTIQEAYGIWNAGIALTTVDGLRFGVIAKNLANKHYSTNLATFGQGVVRFVPRDDHRYFGFNVRKDF